MLKWCIQVAFRRDAEHRGHRDGTVGWRSQKGLAGGREKLKGCLKTDTNGSSQRPHGGVTATDGKGVVMELREAISKGRRSAQKTVFPRMNEWAMHKGAGQVPLRVCRSGTVEGIRGTSQPALEEPLNQKGKVA